MKNIDAKLKMIERKINWLESVKKNVDVEVMNELSFTNWFKNHNMPVFFDDSTKMIHSHFEKNQRGYLSFEEQNTNFNFSPKRKLLNIEQGRKIDVNFSGEIEENIEISLQIISYANGNKINVEKVNLNSNFKLKLPTETDNLRFALLISGKGRIRIHKLKVDNLDLWNIEKINSKFTRLPNANWFIPAIKEVIYTRETSTFFTNLQADSFIYIPYEEANANFSSFSKNLKIGNEKLTVQFNGVKDVGIDVQLFLIIYSDEEKIDVLKVKLNEKCMFNLSEKAKFMRLALRVSGAGRFTITEVIVSNHGYWIDEEITFAKEHVELAYDQVKELNTDILFPREGELDKLIYHPEHNLYESKLIGNQRCYISCLEDLDLTTPPKQSLIIPKKDFSYEFYLSSYTHGAVEVDLLITEWRYSKRIALHQIEMNKKTTIEFNESSTHIKVFLCVKHEGFFGDLKIAINENPIEIRSQIFLDPSPQKWFNNKKNLLLTNEDNVLVGNSEGKDNKYISYIEKNNSYTSLPKNPIMTVNAGSKYHIDIKSEADGGVVLIPMLVTYNDKEKIEVITLKVNSENKIIFKDNVDSFRIAIRIDGAGTFKINSFSISEKANILTETEIKDLSKKAVNALGLVPKKTNKMKMAVIFDEFTTASYQDECELITFTPDNWKEVVVDNTPDLLMVESAWQGNGGSWNKQIGYYGEDSIASLKALIGWCNEKNIPTVFWNKEDPVHFERFIETAKYFDHIYTTDENMIPEYQKRVGHTRVYALPFAAQPTIHNPIKIVNEKENAACFAGSYYRHHEDRCVDMDRVIDGAAKYGLVIYDRNFEKNQNGEMPNHEFPDRFKPFIKGNLRYYEIDKAYKGYKVVINVNTVKESPTMFSRRVFEALACGSPVVSTYALGIENIFGDLVDISEDADEIDNSFKLLLTDKEFYEKKAHLGMREVLSKHTYSNRLEMIVKNAGLNFSFAKPVVTVVGFAKTSKEFYALLNDFNRQCYEEKQLYVLIEPFEDYLAIFNEYNSGNVKTFIKSYVNQYRNILEWIKTQYITYFNTEDYYGEHYLTDLMNATLYAKSDFIGKGSYYTICNSSKKVVKINDGMENQFVSILLPSCTIVKREVFKSESLVEVIENWQANEPYSNYNIRGKLLYSTDSYNYIKNKKIKSKKKSNLKQIKNMLKTIEI